MIDKASPRRVLVALDTGDGWQELLEQAARVAQAMQAELHTLFVEDEDLHTIAELPFTVEIALYPARAQAFSPDDLSRSRRDDVRRARALFEQVLHETRLHGDFQVTTRRSILVDVTHRGDIVWLKRHSTLMRLPIAPPKTRDCLYIAVGTTDTDDETLAVAQAMLRNDFRELVIFNLGDTPSNALTARFSGGGKPVLCRQLASDMPLTDLLSMIDNRTANTLLLPDDLPQCSDRDVLAGMLGRYRFDVVLVR